MINNIQPDTIVKDKFDNAMYNFCKKLTHNAHKYYIKQDDIISAIKKILK